MKKEEKLYEILGELLYAVAIADGVVQKEEKDALKNLLSRHPFGDEIIWSFEYEETKHKSIEDIYKRVINYCHSYGPAPAYKEFIEAMNMIAEATNGIDKQELQIINSFSVDLLSRFKRDIEKLKEYETDNSDID